MSLASAPSLSQTRVSEKSCFFHEEILECLPNPILAVTDTGHIRFANNAARSIFGLSPPHNAEVVLDSVYFPYNPHSGKLHDSVVRLFSDRPQREPTQRLIRIEDRSGKQLTALEHGVRVTVDNTEKFYILVTLYLQDYVNRLVIIPQKMDSFSRLVSGFAHDFNNLLTVVTSNLFMARCSFNVQNEITQMLGEAEKAAFKASNLTSQLLVLCDRGEIVNVETDIKTMIQNMIGFIVTGELHEYNLDFPDDLHHISCDPGKIDQILEGLIKNAVEALPSGGLITIKAENIALDSGSSPSMPTGDYLQITISDNGTGIQANDMDKVFDPYFTTKKDAKGLGLTIAYSVIEQHHGHIEIHSTSTGTSVRLILPAYKKIKTEQIAREKPAVTGKILLMDDEESIRLPIQKILISLGYEVEIVSDGSEVLEKIQETQEGHDPFDVILLDLTVKDGMGGEKTAKELLSRYPGTRIVLMSGYINDPLMVHYKEHGFVGAITKPFSIDDINACLQSVLETPK